MNYDDKKCIPKLKVIKILSIIISKWDIELIEVYSL